MSTKNIARTAIEGGRVNSNKNSRYESNRKYRAQSRMVKHRLARAEDPGEVAPIPRREKVDKEFDDRLGAPERWLASQVNRPWSKVYAEMRERFDTRTTAGRHIVFDHMLQWVDVHGKRFARAYSYYKFVLDDHGILRKAPPRVPVDFYGPHRSGSSYEVDEFLNKRRVGLVGAIYFWYVAQNFEWGACPLPHRCKREHQSGLCLRPIQKATWHRARPLTDPEIAFWKSIDPNWRKTHLVTQG